MTAPKGGSCHSCSAELAHLDYGRGDSCPQCGRDTRVCRNCTFFDGSAHNQCRENQADRVVDKDRSNFCDYFSPRAAGTGANAPSRDALKAAADALFRKK